MKKIIFVFILLFTFSYSKECSPYFNPDKFYKTPELLNNLLDENFPNGIFINQDFKHSIKKNNEVLKKNSFVEFGDYIYPKEDGFWKYKKIDDKISEVNLARAEIYKFDDIDIANTINDNFQNFWLDYIENAYEMRLTPEQTLFRYNDVYFTMSVFIYGVKGDSTPLKGTVVNFLLKDYTKEVNTYIKCMKE